MPQYVGLSDNYKNARARAFGLTKDGDRLPEDMDSGVIDRGIAIGGAPGGAQSVAQMNVPPAEVDEDLPPSQPDQYSNFQDETRGRLAERMMMGREQAEGNRVTREDIEGNRDAANRRALLGALSESTAQIGNIRGEYKPSTLGKSFEQMTAADESAMKGRQQLTEQGLREEGLYKDVGELDEQNPDSYISQQTQGAMEKLLGKPPGTLKGASAKQLEQSFGFLGQQVIQNQRQKFDEEQRLKQQAFQSKQAEKDQGFKVALEGMKNKSEKPLKVVGAEEMKRFDNIKMVDTAVDDMFDAFQSGENTFSVVGDNNFTEAARRFAEGLGRLQSGGAISTAEEARFRAMVPKVTDPLDMQQKKILKMKAEMKSRLQGFHGKDVPMYTPRELSFDKKESPVGNKSATRFAPGTIPMAD